MQAPEREPVIVGAARTPVGRRNGGLAGLHAVDLARRRCVPWWTAAASTRTASRT